VSKQRGILQANIKVWLFYLRQGATRIQKYLPALRMSYQHSECCLRPGINTLLIMERGAFTILRTLLYTCYGPLPSYEHFYILAMVLYHLTNTSIYLLWSFTICSLVIRYYVRQLAVGRGAGKTLGLQWLSTALYSGVKSEQREADNLLPYIAEG